MYNLYRNLTYLSTLEKNQKNFSKMGTKIIVYKSYI